MSEIAKELTDEDGLPPDGSVAESESKVQDEEIEDGAAEAVVASKQSQATKLVALTEACELFHTPQGECFASVAVGEHVETHAIHSTGFRRWLRHEWYSRYRTAPGAQAMADALALLDARATYHGSEAPVFTRIGEYEGIIYLDLANEEWEAVAIYPFDWRVTRYVPIKFRRPRGMKAIPCPVRGGTIDALRPFVNVPSEADFILVASWVASALRSQGPYPVLVLQGEQGSAKSTTARVLRALVDPSEAPLRSEPRDARDLMIAATNAWMQAYDNLSHLRPWLSDALCRLATGGGFATRELYTNTEEAIFDAQRPVLLNGIEEVATRSDLLDRALILNLPSIPEDKRKPERTFWADFDDARPVILGALLDAVSVAMRLERAIQLPTAPRMADFAILSSACAAKFGWGPDAFRRAYGGNRESAHELALEGSPVSTALRELVTAGSDWVGTAAELLESLPVPAMEAERRRLGWPGNARALSGVLRRMAPNLRATGIEVSFLPASMGGGERSASETPGEFATPASPPSPAAPRLLIVDLPRPPLPGSLRHRIRLCVTLILFASPPQRCASHAESRAGDAGDAKYSRGSGAP